MTGPAKASVVKVSAHEARPDIHQQSVSATAAMDLLGGQYKIGGGFASGVNAEVAECSSDYWT